MRKSQRDTPRNDSAMSVITVRVYGDHAGLHGYRVLVDRVWPRGVSKTSLRLNEWCRDVAPTTGLRTWFGHDPSRRTEFRRRYGIELQRNVERLDRLRAIAREQELILLYSARDRERNQAVVLKEALVYSTRAPRRRKSARKKRRGA